MDDELLDLLERVWCFGDAVAREQLWQRLTGRMLPLPSEDTGPSTARAGRVA